MINWKTTKADAELIAMIVKRVLKLDPAYDPMTCNMDITAAHANGNPIELVDLLNADDFNFAHDVFGIRRHINRDTGKLENCFVPRFSAKYAKTHP